MAKKNDTIIIELKREIANKKKSLAVGTTPLVTNCSLPFRGERYNLHVLKADELTNVAIELNMYKMSAADLGVELPIIGGYTVDQWIADLMVKLSVATRQTELARLKVMEDQLHALLSNEKKTELLLDEIKGKI